MKEYKNTKVKGPTGPVKMPWDYKGYGLDEDDPFDDKWECIMCSGVFMGSGIVEVSKIGERDPMCHKCFRDYHSPKPVDPNREFISLDSIWE